MTKISNYSLKYNHSNKRAFLAHSEHVCNSLYKNKMKKYFVTAVGIYILN